MYSPVVIVNVIEGKNGSAYYRQESSSCEALERAARSEFLEFYDDEM